MDSTHPRLSSLLPVPRSCTPRPGRFALSAATRVVTDRHAASAARRLAEALRRATGFPLAVSEGAAGAVDGAITVRTDAAAAGLGAEGYRLSVTEGSVTITGAAAAGCFYGTQTVLQLLPPEVFAAAPARGIAWDMPCAEIEDAPRFPWRGLMLDTARHFFTAAEVERVLDLAALHKLNVLHLHLTDDQGWRLEVPKHPLLTAKSAWRKDIGFGLDPKSATAYGPDGRYGGFFSRADVAALVAAAAHRHVTIVPEVEMPGHAMAALSAYPHLGCKGAGYDLDAKAGIFTDIYCAGRDDTFSFLQDVLDEVFAQFPGRFVHIGGDEAPKETWHSCPRCQARMKAEGLRDEKELQSWFIRRIARFVEERGRRLVGWSEIMEGGLARNATVMDWIGGGLESARDGHEVVMTPTTHCYLDYAQLKEPGSTPVFPNSHLPLSKVRELEPLPAGLETEHHARILGTQGNLWTEYVPSLARAEYQLFPRLSAIAEVAWSPAGAGRADFDARIRAHVRRLQAAGVRCCTEVE